MLSLVILLSSLAALSIADSGCCECTETSDGPNCNDECDATICAYDYDPYCCNVEWDSLCVQAAEFECNGGYGDYGSYGDYDDYGYDDQCNCDEICGEGPEEWEFEYEAIPACVIESCGTQCDTCASDDECVAGIESIVNECYYPDKDPQECMDELIADTENNGFTQACNGNAECGSDLQALGECVVNSANYGDCSEEELKKASLKSLAKTIKIKSRKLKRKSAALKSKSKRARGQRKRSRKVRGKRQSKLRKSRRKLLSENENECGSDYENPEYDYGCYCNCGEEDDEIPPCITEACGEQLMACQDSQNCVDGVNGVEDICIQQYDTPEQCVEELIQDSNGDTAIQLCNGDAEAAGDLQALGQCVLTTFNNGDCDQGQYKKLRIKALVKSTKKVRARKVASRQRRSRSVRRARSSRAQRLRKLKLGKLKGRRQRPRSRVEASKSKRARAQRGRRSERKLGSRSRKEAKRVRSQRKLKQRSRRKLLAGSTSCCECTESSYSPNCNEECDNTICPYDSYCCNYSWDWICANSAVYECDAAGGNQEPEEPPSDPDAGECCDCTDSKGTPNCNEGCDATICPYDSYCCNYSWDWICANSAVQECAAAEEIPSDESCCDCTESQNTPNCNEQCDNTICPYDSYCCNYSWDWICANSAVYECDAAEGGNEEPEEPPTTAGGAECCDCTSSKGTPNCNEGCDGTICPYDSYCCNYSWDWICANSAVSECAAANESEEEEIPTDGSCCDCTESKNTPNCNEQCDSTICPYDSYCCNNSWDWICANSAVQECDAAEGEEETEFYPPQSGSTACCECTDSSDSANCNQGCDDTICPYDPYCCNNKWDWICADAAKSECEAAAIPIYEGEETNPQQGTDEACCECTETESTSGCTPNPSCDAIVCPIDFYCCNYSWDGICANGANNICNAAEYWSWPTEEETGSCCDCTDESDSSGCNEVCENEVCPLDSYCCNNKWDWICANGAENICQGYDYFNSGSDGYDDSYNYDYYEPYYSDNYGYDSYNYDYSNYEPYYYDSFDYGYSSDSDYYEPSYSSYDSYNYNDYDTYEPYSYYGGYDSFNDYGYSSYEPNYYDYYSSDYGYSSDYSYYEPSYDYYDSFNYGSNDYEPYYYGGYSSYEPYYYDYGYSSDYSYYGPSYDYYDSDNYGYGDYYYDDSYYYGGYDSYNSYQDEEDFEDVPECFEAACGYEIYQCVNSPDCFQGLDAGEKYCEDNHETSEECVETLIQESQSQQVAGFCNGNETAAGYLQELGQCFLNTITSGECPEEQQKQLQVKALVKAGKKLKTRKVRAKRQKQRKARSSKRESLKSRSSKLRQQNKRPERLQRRVRSQRQRSTKVRPRSRARSRRSLMAQRQRGARSSGKTRSARVQKRRQRQRPQRSRRARARGRSRKALAQVQRQRRSRKARRQSKRLRRN